MLFIKSTKKYPHNARIPLCAPEMAIKGPYTICKIV